MISAECSQQRGSLMGFEFCESIQSTLLERARTTMEFVDDIDSKVAVSCVARDVQAIVASHSSTSLILIPHKGEITAQNSDIFDNFPIFENFKRVALQDMTLLGASVLQGSAVDNALWARLLPSRDRLLICRSTTSFVEELDYNAKTSVYLPNISLRQQPLLNEFDNFDARSRT